jgi:hypothetical protein
MSVTIGAPYFREKIRVCLRLAEGLPWNSPARYQPLLLAEDFQLREREAEGAWSAQRRRPDPADDSARAKAGATRRSSSEGDDCDGI